MKTNLFAVVIPPSSFDIISILYDTIFHLGLNQTRFICMEKAKEPLVVKIAQALDIESNIKKVNIRPKSSEYDILIYKLIENCCCDILSEVQSSTVNQKIVSKIKLNRPAVFENLFSELHSIQFKQILAEHVTEVRKRDEQNELCISVMSTYSNTSQKDSFLNLANKMLGHIFMNLFSETECNINYVSNSLEEEVDIVKYLKEFSTLLDYYTSLATNQKPSTSKWTQSIYLTTVEREDKCCYKKEFSRIVCGSFQIKDADKFHTENALFDYLSNRYLELLKQAEERLEHGSTEVEKSCQDLLPFIVLCDFFASSTTCNPNNLATQGLRDSIFIQYNIARIAHIQRVYCSLSTPTNKTDLHMLSSEIEWEIACHLINFYKVFEESILLPVKKSFEKTDSKLDIHKLLQYLVKLVKLFSKYYSSTKIITYDMKEKLVIRMNTRMLLVNSVYNVLVFTLRDVFGVKIILNM